MAVHYPGDYGGDVAAGAKIAADANGLEFVSVETSPGTDNQAAGRKRWSVRSRPPTARCARAGRLCS
jgi:hypothetical protein